VATTGAVVVVVVVFEELVTGTGVLGVPLVDVVAGPAALAVVLEVLVGSLSPNSSAVSAASSTLACGILLPASRQADASGARKDGVKDRISSGHL
jgi:hypothetical protein